MLEAERVLRAFYQAWGVPDLEAILALVADDVVYENVPVATRLVGREAFREWFSGGLAALDRIDVAPRTVLAEGEMVMMERVDDHIAGDRHMILPVVNVSRVVDGRIVEYRDYFDLDTVRAIGLA